MFKSILVAALLCSTAAFAEDEPLKHICPNINHVTGEDLTRANLPVANPEGSVFIDLSPEQITKLESAMGAPPAELGIVGITLGHLPRTAEDDPAKTLVWAFGITKDGCVVSKGGPTPIGVIEQVLITGKPPTENESYTEHGA
jgi:hypothetical protein